MKKKKRADLHAYGPTNPTYDCYSTPSLIDGGHFSTGVIAYDTAAYAREAEEFNKEGLWEECGFRYSTKHSVITLKERFPVSLGPFLEAIEPLCVPTTSGRPFQKQRIQGYGKSGELHRDGQNAEQRVCVTLMNPSAPPDTKTLKVWRADPTAGPIAPRAKI